jgi:hypothetical protein
MSTASSVQQMTLPVWVGAPHDCFWAILHSSLLGGCRQMHRENDHNFCSLIGSVVVAEPAVLHAK